MDAVAAPGAAGPHTAAALAARACYGKLLAYLAWRWHDLAAAEDALAEAFAAALETWPASGVPARPEAWLLTTARHKLVDGARRRKFLAQPEVMAVLEQGEDEPSAASVIPDDRLRLLFVCAHPGIDAAVRPALMLQVVLGLDVRSMAGAFMLSPETLNKRLVRAKQRLRSAGIRFEAPADEDLPQRLHCVLEAIYAAYFLGRESVLTAGDAGDELRGESLYLGELVAAMLPGEPEAIGFLALLRFCESRRSAQVDASDRFVPLPQQDPRLWDAPSMRQGYELLARAAALGRSGPFQLEAAIHAAHCYRARSGATPWPEIAHLYDALVEVHPGIGPQVARAVAHCHASGDAARALAMLDQLEPDAARLYQPWWVARAHLLETAGDRGAARGCVVRALALTTHPRIRRFLASQLEGLEADDRLGGMAIRRAGDHA